MGSILLRLFNLHPGEEKKAALFVVLGFLWALGGFGGFTLSEGMFLEKVGADALPAAYFAIALGMCLLSSLLIYALGRLPVHKILLYVIVGSIIADVVLYGFLTYSTFAHSKAFWFCFKVIGWIIPIATYICFWAFLDQYFDLQDGKRFFCLFNSILFLGDAFGGGIITFLLEPLGISSLLAIFTFTLIASLPFIFLILKRIPPLAENHTPLTASKGHGIIRRIFRIICSSPFTIYLMLFYFAMQLLAITTEYNYMHTFERTFSLAGSDQNLTKFLGTCGMWVSLGNMLFGLFFYSRLVQKMGLNNIVLVAPTFFFALFLSWFYRDALPIAIMGFIGREGMTYTFDDNNLNLLISGVPSRVKNQVRVAIESFFEPAGMFVCAILLLFFHKHSTYLGIILSCLALLVVLLLRFHYPKAIFHNLVESSISFKRRAAEWIGSFSMKEKSDIEQILLLHLRKSDEPTQLLVYEYLLILGKPQILRRLLNIFGHLSLPGKLKALNLIGKTPWAKESMVIERLQWWRRASPHPELKSAIHFYFASHELMPIHQVAHDLQSNHLGLRGAAILALKRNNAFAQQANAALHELLLSEQEEEICMGLRVLASAKLYDNLDLILPFLTHRSLTVKRLAAAALARTSRNFSDSSHSPLSHISLSSKIIRLLTQIQDSPTRLFCVEALEKLLKIENVKELILAAVHFRPRERKEVQRIIHSVGDRVIDLLLEIIQDSAIHVRCRLLAGKILAKLSAHDLKSHLYRIVREEIDRAYFYYYHAHTIQKQIPQQDLSIVASALSTAFDSILDFIVQLIAIAGAIEECDLLSYSLKSTNNKTRAQAVEALQKACSPNIYSLLHPLIDRRDAEQRLHFFLKRGGIPLNLTQLLEIMTHSPFVCDQIVSIALKARLNTPGWRQTLEEKTSNKTDIFQRFAKELLER